MRKYFSPSSYIIWLKDSGVCADSFWFKVDYLYKIRWKEGHPTCKIRLVNLHSELKAYVVLFLEGKNRKCKTNTHNTTSDNPIFMHIQWIWNSTFWLRVENPKNYRKYMLPNTCHLFHTLFTFTERIHLGPKQSFRYVLDVWKEDSAFSVSG